MPVGFGMDQSVSTDGQTTVGTSAQDIRRIFGSLYTEGIISGADVTTTNGLTYNITPGLVNLWYAGSGSAKESIMMPIDSATVTTTAGPGSGTRIDYVWARQNPPSTNTSTGSKITYGVSSTNPRTANSGGQYFVLAEFDVPTGMTKTSSATKRVNRVFSVPHGSGGLRFKLIDTYNGKLSARPGGLATLTGSVNFPTDTQIKITCGVTLSTDAGVIDGINAGVSVDGSGVALWRTSVTEKRWGETWEWSDIINVTAGTHIFDFRRSEILATGGITLNYAPNNRPGSYMYVETMGIIA